MLKKSINLVSGSTLFLFDHCKQPALSQPRASLQSQTDYGSLTFMHHVYFPNQFSRNRHGQIYIAMLLSCNLLFG